MTTHQPTKPMDNPSDILKPTIEQLQKEICKLKSNARIDSICIWLILANSILQSLLQ